VGSDQKDTERQRRDTYPNTYFGSNSTPCFFNNATNSCSKRHLLVVPLLVLDIPDDRRTIDLLTLENH
jgi:hypothetical protein